MKRSFKQFRKSGNISIVVLFVLTISSLIALFVFQQTHIMLHALGQITRYYQSQALAKAGMELGLVLANAASVGFEQKSISLEHALLQQNFLCAKQGYGCDFSVDVDNRTYAFLTNDPFGTDACTSGNAFTLKEGESLIVPLFVDQRKVQVATGVENALFSRAHSGYNILASFPKTQTQEDGIFFYPFRTFATTDETFDVVISFASSLESNEDEVERQKMVRVLTGLSYTDVKSHHIINDFLYSETGAYYRSEKVGNEQVKVRKIPSKIEVFGRDEGIRNFLILSYPTHCPWNAINSGDLLQVKDRKPKNGQYFPFYLKDDVTNYHAKKWTNCMCPTGFTYDMKYNTCVKKSSQIVDFPSAQTGKKENGGVDSVQTGDSTQAGEGNTVQATTFGDAQISGENIQALQQFPETFPPRYLQFCLYIKGKELSSLGIPTQYVRVSSFGTYGTGLWKNQTSFQALQKIDFPDRLFHTVIER